MGRHWGRAIVTGLARVDGWPVAVVASDPYFYGGGWDGPSAEKFTRFVDLAQTFHLPVLNLVDIAGFQIGVEAERAGIMRYGARALAAAFSDQGAVDGLAFADLTGRNYDVIINATAASLAGELPPLPPEINPAL